MRLEPRSRVLHLVLMISGGFCALFFVSFPLCVFVFAATDMDGHERQQEPIRSLLNGMVRTWVGIGGYAFAMCFCIGAIVFLSSQQMPRGVTKRANAIPPEPPPSR
jgi:hypothetical protein